jgi:hypothetical protein
MQTFKLAIRQLSQHVYKYKAEVVDIIILMCDVPCILVYDWSNYTNICTNYFFITYTRLHVSTLLGHHQGAIDYQRLQNKMCKNE